MKPFAPACERNKEPILTALKEGFSQVTSVLEIGSGTGQHAAYFARHLPHLTWCTSDLAENHVGIRMWLEAAELPNLVGPLDLNIDRDPWPTVDADAVFTANTLHIVSWARVERCFARVGAMLPQGGLFCTYGPFNYGGSFSSPSNEQFEGWLRARDPQSGIRDLDDLSPTAARSGLALMEDREMPANNRLLFWVKTGS